MRPSVPAFRDELEQIGLEKVAANVQALWSAAQRLARHVRPDMQKHVLHGDWRVVGKEVLRAERQGLPLDSVMPRISEGFRESAARLGREGIEADQVSVPGGAPHLIRGYRGSDFSAIAFPKPSSVRASGGGEARSAMASRRAKAIYTRNKAGLDRIADTQGQTAAMARLTRLTDAEMRRAATPSGPIMKRTTVHSHPYVQAGYWGPSGHLQTEAARSAKRSGDMLKMWRQEPRLQAEFRKMGPQLEREHAMATSKLQDIMPSAADVVSGTRPQQIGRWQGIFSPQTGNTGFFRSGGYKPDTKTPSRWFAISGK